MPGDPIAVGGSLVFMFFQLNRVKLNKKLIDFSAIPVENYLQGGYKIGTKLNYDYTIPDPKKEAKVPSAYKKFLLGSNKKPVIYVNNSILLDPDENAPEIEQMPVTDINPKDPATHIALLNPPNGAELFKRSISILKYQLRNVRYVNVCIYKGEFNKIEKLEGVEPMQRYESFDTEKFNITQFVKYAEEGFYTVVLADHNDEIRAMRNYYITNREVPAYVENGSNNQLNTRRSSYLAVPTKNRPAALPDSHKYKRSKTQDFLARTMTSAENRVTMIKGSTDYQDDLRRSMIDPRTGTPKALSSTTIPKSYKKSKH